MDEGNGMDAALLYTGRVSKKWMVVCKRMHITSRWVDGSGRFYGKQKVSHISSKQATLA